MPRISIIMTGYNAAATIERAIDSVLAQTYTDWELIVIDDGSTDHTPTILDAIRQRHPHHHLTFLTGEPNIGLPLARNKAMDLATGRWITFLDADDEYTPDRLQQAVDAMNDQTDIIVCRHHLIDYRGIRRDRGVNLDGNLPGRQVALEVLSESFTPYVWDKVYRTEALDGLRFERVEGAEDKVFNVSANMIARSVRFTIPSLITYHMSPTSLTWGRVSSIAEAHAVDRAIRRASEDLAWTPQGQQALRASRILAYQMPIHQAIFNRRPTRGLTDGYSWRDIMATLRLRPLIGAAAGLCKLSAPAYSLVYRKLWVRHYGL